MDHSSLLEAVAPCGLRCDNCLASPGGEIHRHAKALSELLGFNFSAYAERLGRMNPVFENYPGFRDLVEFLAAGSCGGCRTGGCLFEGCRIPDCSKEHGVDYCFQCSEFPCDKSGFPLDLEVRWRRNNEKMRDMGVAAYFELIKDKPRYP